MLVSLGGYHSQESRRLVYDFSLRCGPTCSVAH